MVRLVVMSLAFVLLPIGAAVLAWIRLGAIAGVARIDRLTRVLLTLTILAAGATLLLMSNYIMQGVHLDWNAGKLAPILAMVKAEPRGEPLYQDPDTGVMTAWIYGPVPALVFLPTAIFSRPTSIIVWGITINVLCALGPALWAHLRARSDRTPDETIIALLMFGVFVWIGLTHESLRRAIYIVGPDGPALGFAVLSCVLLMRKRDDLHLALAGLCAVLSCWSKQTMLPFVLAAPVYLLLVDRRIATRYVMYLLGAGAVVSIIFFLAFSPRDVWFTRRWLHNMWFHMVTVSAQHPWQEDANRPLAVWHAVGELLFDSTEMIVLLLATMLILMLGGAFRGARSRDGRRRWLDANPWVIFAVCGVLLVPSAILGYVKIGGYVNNFALVGFMITLAATVAMAMNWPRIDPPPLRSLVRVLASGVIVMRTLQIVFMSGNAAIMWSRIRDVDDNQQERAYEFARSHPGVVYFPWNNLSMLLAERKLYHFEWGIVDRYYSGYPWTVEQVRAHIPPNARALGFGPMVQSMNALQLFPELRSQLPPRDDLPGFLIVAQPGAQLPAAPTTAGSN